MDISNVLLDPIINGCGLRAPVMNALGDVFGKGPDLRIDDVPILHRRPVAGAHFRPVLVGGDHESGIAIYCRNGIWLFQLPALGLVGYLVPSAAARLGDFVSKAIPSERIPQSDRMRFIND